MIYLMLIYPPSLTVSLKQAKKKKKKRKKKYETYQIEEHNDFSHKNTEKFKPRYMNCIP